MLIIQFSGGLGNQMFLYGLYYSFQKKGINTKIDLSHYATEKNHNGYELEKVFSFKIKSANQTENFIYSKISKLLHLLTQRPYKEKFLDQYIYNEKVSQIRFGYLRGYWQSEKYFLDFSNHLRNEFTFPPLIDEKNIEIENQIRSTNAVSIHIRRGDYLLSGRKIALDLKYYQRAMEYIHHKITNPVFYVFSDDIKWVKENFNNQHITLINWNTGNNSYIDMQLMSLCKHNIIANSSFSWWGAWLNKYSEKIVIAPAKWMPHLTCSNDLIPKNWVQLNNSF